ncbi:hypothetical protein AMQ84_02700 [Paenibacillus riograndensis]|uniref:Uncharacterized protein n=1 Tax=Paenibacillus riograndensis TaxID=483937 RepID=A0A132UAW5_9BACL|nr:hypothetical protein [Paenibacillus riograndensis]KWX80690.1 hypothetical protein AMQ84_02700 [Paenibacillus riograndensis]
MILAKLLVELLTENQLEDEEFISWNKIDLGEFELLDDASLELDKSSFVNLRHKAALLANIITDFSQIEYPLDRMKRHRHEINGGYKIAKRRGARLNEVEVYNLLFRFTDPKRRDAIAIMYRTERFGMEKILLLPDKTQARFKQECRSYLNEAAYLVLRQKMDPDDQSELIENLRCLNVHERCAQTLQHEFGHVLHWREWDALDIHNERDILTWFLEYGYYEIVDRRVPGFSEMNIFEKLLVLKESLVEDYRVSLNIKAERGKFILPNKFCFTGDFEKPNLMNEGVEIMKRMLDDQISDTRHRSASSSDYDSLKAIAVIQRRRRRNPNWVAGESSITTETIKSDYKQLDAFLEVASTNEKVEGPVKTIHS